MLIVRIAFLSLFLIVIGGCGERKHDHRDPSSLQKMMSGMDPQEQQEFLSDVDLVVQAIDKKPEDGFGVGDPSYKIDGYTVKDIKESAKKIRGLLKEHNIKFLRETIGGMQREGRSSILLRQTSEGVFFPPKPGFIPKEYSLEALKTILFELSPQDKNIETAGVIQSGSKSDAPQSDIDQTQQNPEPDSTARPLSEPQGGQPANTLMGDRVDDDPNAAPNTKEDAANKLAKKSWQDGNGRIHHPDGSISSHPVD